MVENNRKTFLLSLAASYSKLRSSAILTIINFARRLTIRRHAKYIWQYHFMLESSLYIMYHVNGGDNERSMQ